MSWMPDKIYDQWIKVVTDSMRLPQSTEQVRREWFKTLKTDELWEVHDDIVKEIRSRDIS